jgi:phenylacetate-CoA ligase
MQATGGTTSRPMRMALTRRDVAVYNEIGARAAWSAGLRPGDVVFECMNYAMYAGGVNDHMTFETVGACVAPVGIGQSKRLLQVASDMGTDAALYSTPSYALHLAATARAEGIEPTSLRIRKGLFSGDAGLEDPGIRASFESAFGMVARNIFGTSETAPIGAECDATDGLHFVGQGAYLAELIDIDSGEVIEFGDDVVGELVLTTLDRQAHPLIRMRTHDHVRVATSPCACGRTGFRFHVLGRSDDMFIVRGINVYPLAVGTVIAEFRPRLNGEFQVVLRDAPPHERPPLIRAELAEAAGGVADGAGDELAAALAARIHDLLVFTPEIELVAPGTLPRTETKTRRIVRAYLETAP